MYTPEQKSQWIIQSIEEHFTLGNRPVRIYGSGLPVAKIVRAVRSKTIHEEVYFTTWEAVEQVATARSHKFTWEQMLTEEEVKALEG